MSYWDQLHIITQLSYHMRNVWHCYLLPLSYLLILVLKTLNLKTLGRLNIKGIAGKGVEVKRLGGSVKTIFGVKTLKKVSENCKCPCSQ